MEQRQQRCRGQSTAEYAVVIAIVLAAAIGMQKFVQRGYQAKMKTAAVSLSNVVGTGEFSDFKAQEQYEPYYNEEKNLVTKREDKMSEQLKTGGEIARTNTGTDAIQKATQRAGGQIIEHGDEVADYDQRWQ